MIGIIGILGCGFIIAGIIIAAASIATSIGVGVANQKATEKATQKNERLQAAANAKAEIAAKNSEILNNKLAAKNELAARQTLGTAILTAEVIKDRNYLKAAKERADFQLEKANSGKHTQATSQSHTVKKVAVAYSGGRPAIRTS